MTPEVNDTIHKDEAELGEEEQKVLQRNLILGKSASEGLAFAGRLVKTQYAYTFQSKQTEW